MKKLVYKKENKMIINNIFLITPIGNEVSPERIHADGMYNNIFIPLSNDLKCIFIRADTEPNFQVLSEKIFSNIKDADLIIADTAWNNGNVFYEIGLSHAMNKPVIILNPDGNKIPFDIAHIGHITYNLDRINTPPNADVIARLQNDLIKKIKKLETRDNDEVLDTLVYSKSFKETPQGMLGSILKKINDLEQQVTLSQSKSRVVAEYIEGENNAFVALTEVIMNARKTVKTTRFSPYSVVGRQGTFFRTIRDAMDQKNLFKLESFERIIAPNNEEKFDEINQLITTNLGRNFTIYLSQETYDFEIVIIDEDTIFIHFRRNQKDDVKGNAKNEELISATLKFTNTLVAHEFVQIFKSIINNSTFYKIECEKIDRDSYIEIFQETKKKFSEGLKIYKEKTKIKV
jgi:hypothetical protein